MKSLLLFFGLISFSMVSAANTWTVQPGSKLSFEGTQQGEVFSGQFKKFNAQIMFDPTDLAHAKFDVSVDIASVDSQNSERDDAVRGTDWFDSQRFPQARFVTTAFRALGPGKFEADASLSIRGKTIPLKFPFSWKVNNGGAELNAQVTLDRLAFGIGAGDWADEELVGAKVKVSVDLKLVSNTQ